MAEFLLEGLVFTVMFLLPLLILPVIFMIIDKLRVNRQSLQQSPNAIVLARINFTIFRYVAYLLMIPAIMLLASVVMGYMFSFELVKASMPGLIGAITVAFTWCIYRLVRAVEARSRYEQSADPS